MRQAEEGANIAGQMALYPKVTHKLNLSSKSGKR